jgi:hypothetical protein
MRATLPGMSPTVGLIWAIAMVNSALNGKTPDMNRRSQH